MWVTPDTAGVSIQRLASSGLIFSNSQQYHSNSRFLFTSTYINHSPEVLREKAMKASSPWSSELERRVKGIFLPPGQMNTWNELEFNFIASLLLRDCCCRRHFVAQLSKVMSVQSLSYSEHLNCGWLLLSLSWSASLRDTMYLPGLGTALTEASRMPSWECSGGSVGIPSALTFLEGGRNTGEMKHSFLLFAPKA